MILYLYVLCVTVETKSALQHCTLDGGIRLSCRLFNSQSLMSVAFTKKSVRKVPEAYGKGVNLVP